MRTRRANLEDVARIAEIHVRSWQEAYKDSLPADFLASLDTTKREAMWKGCVRNNGALFVVENEQSKILGFLNYRKSRDEDLDTATELTAIYLDPQYYGSGIGTSFWKVIEEEIDNEIVFLWVLATNELGIAFYKKNGFRPDGKTKTFEIDGQHFEELRYQKKLHNQTVVTTPAIAPR